MIVKVHLVTGEHIPCRNISSFSLRRDRLVLRGLKAGDYYEFEKRKVIGFDVVLEPYTKIK